MKKKLLVLTFLLLPLTAKADLWGGDLPLLAEIVANTLHTLMELERQSSLMEDEMAGIKDKIYRIKTIADVIQPSHWEQWKDPREAMRRLRTVYYTLPKEYRNEKSDMIEEELSKAMNMIALVGKESNTAYKSGKELEQRGADASPGVAQKLTASGVGSLISLEAQTQVIQSHIASLVTQMLADSNEREARSIVTRGRSLSSMSHGLGTKETRFSRKVLAWGIGS